VIRVALVDDQTLVRQGIRGLLELTDDIRVVAEAGDGEEAPPLIVKARPDVLLLDVRMPCRSGLEVIDELRRRAALPPTIVLTTFDDDDVVLRAVRAGARGFLLKDVSLEQLTGAIRAVAAGQTLVQPALTERVARRLTETPTAFASLERPDPLTRREIQILRLLSGGYSNREIAQTLGAAEGTIKNHISSILSKLGVRDRTRAVLRAIEKGYI
jgi:DNA-binding NarL/FixJ family response regulator